MSKYYKAEDVIRAIEEMQNGYNGWSNTYDKAHIIEVLEELPTIDIVICKGCRWSEPNNEGDYDCKCHIPTFRVPKDGYCNFGERLFRTVIERANAPSVVPKPKEGEWMPCSERLPSEEERKEWIDNNLDGIGYLYPCLVTRYSSINPDRTKNNPYVAKHYFDGEDFVNCGEQVCSEYILAWMPLPEPWKGASDEY